MDENHTGPNTNTLALAHTLVGKQCLYDGKVSGSIPGAGNLHPYRQDVQHNGKFLFLVFVAFLCFDFVPFVGDPRECSGYVAFPPLFWAYH